MANEGAWAEGTASSSSGTGQGGRSGVGGGTEGGAKQVQRTQSNPEMEACPVCLARKECEILLKRTYSKVIIMLIVGRVSCIIMKRS